MNKEFQSYYTNQHYIPIVKGSLKKPYISLPNEWFIDWSTEAIRHYNTDKKARFQNSSYYFENGIAIPMLKNKIIKAAIMEGQVFDQGIVGIFPKDPKNKYFILALLNTIIVNDIIHNINPTVNNSANYMKRIPIPECPDEMLIKIDNLVEGILFQNENNKEKIEQIFKALYEI